MCALFYEENNPYYNPGTKEVFLPEFSAFLELQIHIKEARKDPGYWSLVFTNEVLNELIYENSVVLKDHKKRRVVKRKTMGKNFAMGGF